VINTSGNRTLDSDKLFDLAGYNKIRWLNRSLDNISQCALEIYEKQNVLGADDFRIAVLVDFFGFDRIRAPYGRLGYRAETGVDISLYLPYIEVYLLDNLISFLESRDLYASDFEIYYVQNTKLERYEFLDNAKEQLHQILEGAPEPDGSFLDPIPLPEPARDKVPMPKKPKKKKTDDDAMNSEPEEEVIPPEDLIPYTSFLLYCTPETSLRFSLSDYPYGAEAMTFPQFMKAFEERAGEKHGIRRHYYVSNYGGGPARAAFDTLTLSLYLVYMYEREENGREEGELEISRLDAETLKDVLVNAWNKVCLARENAKGNSTKYFSLKENLHIDEENLKPAQKADMDAVAELSDQNTKKMTPEEHYRRVCYYYYRTPEQLEADNRAEFDRLMNEYLRRRDETRELDVEAELREREMTGSLVMTPQFPSKEEYNHLAEEKQKEISTRFDNVLSATYREVDYDEDKERADKAFENYSKVKACLHRNIVGDIIFMILSLLAAVGPYAVLQLKSFSISTVEALILGLETTALFGALFVLAVTIQIIVLTAKLNRAKRELRFAYHNCYKKECDSLAQIRRRYREDLIYIERARYELRQMKYLYDANMAKDANIKRHRILLEELEDRLGSMLNNLDVEPVLDPEESLNGEFDVSKPIRARENRVYRVFSLETIEKLFWKKGRAKE